MRANVRVLSRSSAQLPLVVQLVNYRLLWQQSRLILYGAVFLNVNVGMFQMM